MKRRIVTRIAIGLTVFGGLVALCGGAAYYWSRTDAGRAWIGARLAGAISVPGEREVMIGRLDGDPFGAFRMMAISVRDRKGVWLEIDTAAVHWRPWALLRGRISLERIHVNAVRLLRVPETGDARTNTPGILETLRGLRRYRLDEGIISAFNFDPAVTGEKAAFQVKLSLRTDRRDAVRLSLDVMRRDGKTGRAAFTIALSPSGGSLDLHAEVDEPANGMIAQALRVPDLPPLQARLTGSGPLAEWAGKARLTFESFAAVSATFTLRQGAAVDFEVAADGALAGSERRAIPVWRTVLGDRFEFVMAGAVDPARPRVTVTQARLSGAFGALALSGQYDVSRGDGRATVAIRDHDLSRWAVVLGIPVAGRSVMEAEVGIKKRGRELTVGLNGMTQGLATGQRALDRLLTPAPRIGGRLVLTPENLTVSGLTLKSDAATLELKGMAQPDGSSLDTDYRLAVPAGVSIPVSDNVEIDCPCVATGNFAGALADSRATAEVSAGAVRVGGARAQAAKLALRVRSLAGAVEGALEATAETALGPLTGHAGLAISGDHWRITGLRAETGRSVLDGDLVIPKTGDPVTGTLTLNIRSLAPWLALANLAGDAKGMVRATLRPGGAGQGVTVEGALTDIRIDGAGSSPPLQAERLTVNAESRNLGIGKPFNATLDLRALAVGEARLQSVRAQLGGSTARIAVGTTADGTWNGPLSLKSDFVVVPGPDAVRIEMSGFDGRALGEQFRLAEALHLTWGQGRLDIERLVLSFGQARLAGRLRLKGESVEGAVSAAGFPLELIGRFWGPRLAGSVTGRFDLRGTRTAPTGALSASVAALRLLDQQLESGLSLSLKGRWVGGRLALDGEMPIPGEKPSRLAAELPLRFAEGGWTLVMPAQQPVSALLSWRGDAAALWRFVPLAEHELAGPSVVELELRGSVKRPEFQGSVSLSKGRYESLALGTVLKNLDLRVEINGARATIVRFAADDGAGGKASLSGGMTLDAPANHPFDLRANFTKFMVLRRDEFEAAASGFLRFKGTFRRAVIEGEFDTDRAEIRVLERLPPDVVELEVTEIGQAAGAPEERRREGPRAFDPALAITITMSRRVFIRGRGLDSEWKGKIVLGGTVGTPQIRGEMEIVRGQISVVGKAFRFERGVVRFPDRTDASPILDVTAVHEGRRLTAQAHIEGPVRNPKVTLTSTPSLPQDEIVSQILFDKGASRLSQIEAAQLAIALAQLSGKGGVAGNAMEFARRTLGVDVLRLEETRTAGGESAAAVRAGKYLSEDIYVGVKQGATTESGSVGVEVEVTPNIVVESEVRRSGESDTSIKFKLDY